LERLGSHLSQGNCASGFTSSPAQQGNLWLVYLVYITFSPCASVPPFKPSLDSVAVGACGLGLPAPGSTASATGFRVRTPRRHFNGNQQRILAEKPTQISKAPSRYRKEASSPIPGPIANQGAGQQAGISKGLSGLAQTPSKAGFPRPKAQLRPLRGADGGMSSLLLLAHLNDLIPRSSRSCWHGSAQQPPKPVDSTKEQPLDHY